MQMQYCYKKQSENKFILFNILQLEDTYGLRFAQEFIIIHFQHLHKLLDATDLNMIARWKLLWQNGW